MIACLLLIKIEQVFSFYYKIECIAGSYKESVIALVIKRVKISPQNCIHAYRYIAKE